MCGSQAKHQPSLSNSLIFTISKFQIMKKTYIMPEALVVSLTGNSPILWDGSGDEQIGDGQLVKEQGENGATTGGKSIWDDEW